MKMVECARVGAAVGAFAMVFLQVTASLAAPSAEQKCEATKLREAGKAAACLLKVASKEVVSGSANPDGEQSCRDKFTAKMTSAEAKADGQCPTVGDAAALLDDVEDLVTQVKESVTGQRFIDNGDGTVTDVATDVIWQKTTPGTGSASSADEERDAVGLILQLATLNGGGAVAGLGGSSSWGLPSLDELQSILDCSSLPCAVVDSVLGPNPAPSASGSTFLLSGQTGTHPMSLIPCPDGLWAIRLEDGQVYCRELSAAAYSRARVMRNSR